ncbi:MAG: serine/threonine-protein kinase [Deinococcota bacterium]
MSTDEVRPSFLPEGYAAVFLIGSGQSANVFLATYEHKDEYALKMLKPDARRNPKLSAMFEREVKLTLSLEHKNVVKAREGEATGERAYMALEFYPKNLDTLLVEESMIPLEQAYKIILGVASGLAYVHKQNVLHRDIKPANVFLDHDGTPKLADFGTGIYQNEQQDERAGTVYYMPPEIFLGEPSSVQSDIYSLGVLAYEVLTHRRPFDGDDYENVKNAHLFSVADNPSRHREGLDKRLNKVFAKVLAKEPIERYKTVAEFGKAFQAAISSQAASTNDEPDVGRGSAPRPQVGRGSRNSAAQSGQQAGRPANRPQSGKPNSSKPQPERGGLLGKWFNRKK